ncbi:MAG: hypothetical protein H7239_04840 [Flavobacterium sp.]|nr:hypothetical protein [Flavobacterium sp.]
MKCLICYILILIFADANSQENIISVTELNTVKFDADYFIGCDGFGNCFYQKNDILFKKADSITMQYQNLTYGKLAKVDITNPLKIILFYEQFNSVIVLDNQLNEIQNIQFSKSEIPIVASSIGISAQNQLWVYNSLNQQIGLYDLNANTYKNLGVPIKETFSYYQTDFNYFNWVDAQNQWLTCTIFGNVFLNGKIEANKNLQLLDRNHILYQMENNLFVKDRNLDKLYKIKGIEKSLKKFYYKDQILSIFTTEGITNYKLTIP